MKEPPATTSSMDRWPVHCDQRMLYMGDDTMFEPGAGKRYEQQKEDVPRGHHYYCEMCKRHQHRLPTQGESANDKV